MLEPAWMLLLHAVAADVASFMRACAAACVVDTMYQLIYASTQTHAWRIEFSYRNIDMFWKSSLKTG
jgi:hypothetical protein